MILLLTLLFFIFGAAVGSFLNVVAYRSVHGGSIFFSNSRCPHCEHKLAAADLVPIFSYLFLKRRCRYCNKKISVHYSLVELSTGILFALSFYYCLPFEVLANAGWLGNIGCPNTIGLIYLLFVVSTFIVLTVTD
ncbi:prepilin peptidase, partial [Patescibacteria group bacterium]|nr:prepilin peptidase [Patescibacteria group bacterium]